MTVGALCWTPLLVLLAAPCLWDAMRHIQLMLRRPWYNPGFLHALRFSVIADYISLCFMLITVWIFSMRDRPTSPDDGTSVCVKSRNILFQLTSISLIWICGKFIDRPTWETIFLLLGNKCDTIVTSPNAMQVLAGVSMTLHPSLLCMTLFLFSPRIICFPSTPVPPAWCAFGLSLIGSLYWGYDLRYLQDQPCGKFLPVASYGIMGHRCSLARSTRILAILYVFISRSPWAMALLFLRPFEGDMNDYAIAIYIALLHVLYNTCLVRYDIRPYVKRRVKTLASSNYQTV